MKSHGALLLTAVLSLGLRGCFQNMIPYIQGMKRKPYPIDDQWQSLTPLLPAAKPGGRPRSADLREVVNAIL